MAILYLQNIITFAKPFIAHFLLLKHINNQITNFYEKH